MEASFRQALQAVHSMKDTIEGARVAESSINSVGYRFLNQDKHDAAIKVFKFNVASFPASANVYDSLGEAYMKSGNKQLAIDNYRKALELAPGLPTAKDALLELQK
jgi:cytochrome c-type biogenesis protein CcmH/NrfG